MSKFARNVEGVAVDVVAGDPSQLFHASVASEFVQVPDEVENGWVFDGESWLAPVPSEAPVEVEYAKVSPVEFKLLFTSGERVAIKLARAADPVIDDFYSIVEDPRLTFVDFGLQSTRDALSYMVSKGLLTETRMAQIIGAELQ